VSFPERRDLETGSGYCLTNNSANGLNREYSYPSIVEGPDGSLHIAYTYHRRAIKYVCLRWDWQTEHTEVEPIVRTTGGRG
jgi:predicted neuraminidase